MYERHWDKILFKMELDPSLELFKNLRGNIYLSSSRRPRNFMPFRFKVTLEVIIQEPPLAERMLASGSSRAKRSLGHLWHVTSQVRFQSFQGLYIEAGDSSTTKRRHNEVGCV